jgi:ribosomal protein L37E
MSQGVGADRDDSLDRGDVLHGLNGIVASGGAPVKQSVQEDKRRWYCVCSRCGAKAFSVRQSFACPRCSVRLRSRDQIVPPWHR